MAQICTDFVLILGGNGEMLGAVLARQLSYAVVDLHALVVAFPNPDRWVPKQVVIA
jgi:hypothetical protein